MSLTGRRVKMAVCGLALVAITFPQQSLPAVGAEDVQLAAPAVLRSGDGLTTILFDTAHGKIKVTLPDDTAAGDTVSGAIAAEPNGDSAQEKQSNAKQLSGYGVSLQIPNAVARPPVPSPVRPGTPFKVSLPPGSRIVNVICCPLPPNSQRGYEAQQSPGRQTAAIPISLTPPVKPPRNAAILPRMGQCGRPIQIRTACNGDFRNSKCTFGGVPCSLLAESPRKMIVESPHDQVGSDTLRVQEGGMAAQAPFTNVHVKLVCPKLVLKKGETSTMTITVKGLGGMPATLRLDNNTPDVITVSGGNHQTIPLP